ncbi:MAG TPA: cytochrome c [Candidatus Acidoferrum sp.]|nr:cytochrome c [Candidatus Acidoferrum sp.]
MIRTGIVCALLFVLIAPVAFGGGGGNAAAGKDVFGKKCAVCHGKDGMGSDPMSKVLGVKIPPFSSPDVQKLTDAEMTKVIKEGKGKMKPVADVSATDIANVIAYTRTFASK